MKSMAKIPKFKSDKEAAAFWDTHSLADFDEELVVAKNIRFVKPPRRETPVKAGAKTAPKKRARKRAGSVKQPAVGRKSVMDQAMSVKLARQMLNEIKELARQKGIGHSTMARILMTERLEEINRRPTV